MSEETRLFELDSISELVELALMATPIVGDMVLWNKYHAIQESPYHGRGEPRPFYQIVGAKYAMLTVALVGLEATTGAVSSTYKILENLV